jgi:hypothetical protein
METLTGSLLALLMIGNTHYVDIGKDRDAAIYYASPTVAYMALPDAPRLRGTLEMRETGYFVAWEGGPAGAWSIAHAPGRFVYIRPDGVEAGPITRIVPGNPEGF